MTSQIILALSNDERVDVYNALNRAITNHEKDGRKYGDVNALAVAKRLREVLGKLMAAPTQEVVAADLPGGRTDAEVILDWTRLGQELRTAALDAHEGNLPDLKTAYLFLLDNPEAFTGGGDDEWPAGMPAEPNEELTAAYYANAPQEVL